MKRFSLDWMPAKQRGLAIRKSGNYLWQCVPMLEVRKRTAFLLESNRLSPEKAIRLREFLQTTLEDDNPMIFRGKIK